MEAPVSPRMKQLVRSRPPRASEAVEGERAFSQSPCTPATESAYLLSCSSRPFLYLGTMVDMVATAFCPTPLPSVCAAELLHRGETWGREEGQRGQCYFVPDVSCPPIFPVRLPSQKVLCPLKTKVLGLTSCVTGPLRPRIHAKCAR